MTEFVKLELCGVCSSNPAEGRLGIRIEGETEPAFLLACRPCAAKSLNVDLENLE